MLKYTPLADTVLIELEKIEDEEISSGGIVIARKQTKDVQQKGKESGVVLAMGHLLDSATTGYKIGDKVCFKRYSGTYLEDEDSNLRLLSDADILAVINN